MFSVRAAATPALLLVIGLLSCKEPTAPAVATAVELSIPNEEMAFGSTTTATAIVKDQRGSVMQGATITWSSANTQVFDVSSTGAITPVGTGKAALTATSNGVSASKDITIIPKTVAITAIDSSLAPFAALTIDVGEVIPNLSQATILGVRGTDTLKFAATGAQRVETIVAGLDEGTAPMKVVLGANHVASIPLTISAAPTVSNPQTVVDGVRQKVDSAVASLTAAVTANSGTAANASFAGALGTWFKQTMDTASAPTKLAVAQLLATYPELLAQTASPAVAGISFAESGICSGNATSPEEAMSVCGSRLNLGIAGTALGAVATRTLCKAPNLWCLVALTTTFGAIAVTYDLAKEFAKVPGVVTDGFDGVLTEASPMIVGGIPQSANLLANLNLISGKKYQFSATAKYRSIIAADAPKSNFLSKGVANLTAFDETWQSLVSIVNGLPSAVKSTLPLLPATIGKAPAEPAATKDAPIPLGSLKVSNPSSNITLEYQSNWETNATSVNLKSGLEGDYTFDMTYLSDIGAAKSTASGKIRVQAEISRVSGNDQNGDGSAELLEPLKVLVKNKVTGKPVSSVSVQWVPAEGSGSVSAPTSTTTAEGATEVKWTLGPTLPLQSLNAVVAYADATAVVGSPLQFQAKNTIEGYYDLTSVDGQPMPYNTGSSTLFKSYLELKPNSSFEFYIAETFDGRTEDTMFRGTYTKEGNVLTLVITEEDGHEADETPLTATYQPGTILLNWGAWDADHGGDIHTFKRTKKPAP